MSDVRAAKLNPRVAELAAVLRDFADEAARQFGLPEESAALLADHVTRAVVRNLGGQMLYVPLGYEPGLPPQYQAIWDAFKGDNHAEIAKRLGCSVQHVYRIVSAMRAHERESRNLSLPFSND